MTMPSSPDVPRPAVSHAIEVCSGPNEFKTVKTHVFLRVLKDLRGEHDGAIALPRQTFSFAMSL